MSGRIFHRYLLYYLSASAILVHGSPQRIFKRASCPSCSQDCPEALVSPWYPRRGSDLETGVLRAFSVAPFQNPLHSTQSGIPQNIARHDVPFSQDLISYRNYRNLPEQESAKEYPHADVLSSTRFVDKPKRQNPFFENFPDQVLGEQEILSREQPARKNSLADILSSRQTLGESESFRDPRDKHSTRSLEDQEFEDYAEDEVGPTSELLIVYPENRKPSWKDSRIHTSSSLVLPQKSAATFREENALDEDRNTIKESPSFINQRYDLALAQEGYYPARFGASGNKREPYVLSQNLDVRKFLGDWDSVKDPLETSDLEQLKQDEDNFFEVYPVEEKKTIITGDDNEQIYYNPYILSEDLDTRRPTKDGESFDDWNLVLRKHMQKLQETEQFKKTGDNRPQVYAAMGKDTRYFENEEDRDRIYFADEEGQKYFEEEIEKNTGKATYDPYAQNIWRTMQNRGHLRNLDFTMHKDSQRAQKAEQSEIYPAGKNNNKYFVREENKDEIQSETHANADGITRAPITDFNPQMFPRFLNIFNAPKYSAEPSKKSPETRNNLSRPVGGQNERPYKDETIIQNGAHIQDLIFSKNTFDIGKYNRAVGRKPSTKDNAQNKPLIEFDPDLMDDVEGPPTEPTEPTPMESSVIFSTPEQH